MTGRWLILRDGKAEHAAAHLEAVGLRHDVDGVPAAAADLAADAAKGAEGQPSWMFGRGVGQPPPPPAPKPLHSSAIDSLPSPSLHALPAVAAHEGHRGLAQAAELNRPAAAAALELHLELEGSAVDLDELREG